MIKKKIKHCAFFFTKSHLPATAATLVFDRRHHGVVSLSVRRRNSEVAPVERRWKRAWRRRRRGRRRRWMRMMRRKRRRKRRKMRNIFFFFKVRDTLAFIEVMPA